ncbi:MAG: polysulfide reductase [Sulfurovum sp. AS07-7]|nr:MAG: polysulfide reductase [Sulfurovum sp. AS07-7]
MSEHIISATNAVVSLDVALPSIIWGTIITVNMWAKSIGTGIVLVTAYLWFRHGKESTPALRWMMPVISFVALNIFLLFTLIDLHQPYRMINIFLHPHFTSSITVGAWMASLFTGLITLMAMIGLFDHFKNFREDCPIAKKVRTKSGLYEKVFPFVVFLAIPVTLYTAIIMAQSSARELWQTPAEMAQMLLAAIMAGTASLILISSAWSDEIKKDMAFILSIVLFMSFSMYMGEYFFSYKSAEAEATLAFVHLGGAYSFEFWFAMIVGFVIPFAIAVLNLKNINPKLLKIGAILALVGLFFAKDVWLKIPQMLPLS